MILHLKSIKEVIVNARTMKMGYVHLGIDGVTQNDVGFSVFGQYYEETENGLRPLHPSFNYPVTNEQVNTIAENTSISNETEIERRNLQLTEGTIQILDQLKMYGLHGYEWVIVTDL